MKNTSPYHLASVHNACRNLFKCAVITCALLSFSHPSQALSTGQYVTFNTAQGAFPLVQSGQSAPIYTDKADWPGVTLAATSLQNDVHSVTGQTPSLVNHTESGSTPVIIGTIGHSAEIDSLIASGTLDVKPIKGKWESFIIQVVAHPEPGVVKALVIAGSDKRGTIYGIYDLSESIGVSPWHWWADVPPAHHSEVFVKPTRYVEGPPAVKYRGIFINDEAPSLSSFVAKNYGDFNSKFYPHVFELLLRLKANYLWPAMWGHAFDADDPQNPVLADEYGIVMGTSHQEPMTRADAEINKDIKSKGPYDYSQNKDAIYDFWKTGVDRVKNYDELYTMGMRGTGDTAINAKPDQIITLLQEIVADQRTILSQEVNPDVTKVPQMWCLYKEVEGYYDDGLRVPGDITLLWSDDNNGNLRRVPSTAELSRAGGAGIYYHLDYVGAPRDYKWVCTVPVEKIWQQMNLAYDYDARQIWIVNVGSLKQKEFDINFFLDYARDPNQWPKEKLGDYYTMWAAEQFGPEHAAEIAKLVTTYLKYNGIRKPEQMITQPYNVVNYGEADRMSAKWQSLTDEAEALYAKMPPDQKDAFYELVLYPVKASGNVAQLYITQAKNQLYAKQGRASANDEAGKVAALFKEDADLTNYYNQTLGGGKWGPFMSQVHIGYTAWNDPQSNILPSTQTLTLAPTASMGIAVDGSNESWPGGADAATLPTFDRYNKQTYSIDVFNRGQGLFAYTTKPSASWIVVSPASGSVSKDQSVTVSIDWANAPADVSNGSVSVTTPGADPVSVGITADNTALPATVPAGTLVENQGYVSIEAEHFASNTPSKEASWTVIPNYGKTLSSVMPFPANAASYESTAGAPCLTYNIYVSKPGQANVSLIAAPSLDYVHGRGIRYAIAVDDQAPQVVDLLGGNAQANWSQSVVDQCRISTTQINIDKPGSHTLKIWMVDPGLVLQKIVADFGGAKLSYLGPPESYRVGK